MLRKTKTVCTMGPKCWSEDGMRALLRAGMGVARFNFSHGTHAAHQEVLDRYRAAMKAEGAAMKADLGLEYTPHWACLLDTKGPEIRTAMLKDHEAIMLEAGQAITVESVGDRYVEFEGYKTEAETRIGLSYEKLCASVKPGNVILIADGSISIKVGGGAGSRLNPRRAGCTRAVRAEPRLCWLTPGCADRTRVVRVEPGLKAG